MYGGGYLQPPHACTNMQIKGGQMKRKHLTVSDLDSDQFTSS